MRKTLFFTFLFCTVAAYGVEPEAKRWRRGEGEFVFKEYAPLETKPVTVRFYIPETGDLNTMRVVMVIHGNTRNGRAALDLWKPLALQDGFIVIVPQFDRDLFPVNEFQFGGVHDQGSGKMRPRKAWTYNLIEELFDDFLKEMDAGVATYDMFGHSAGGQFVHRFLLAMPRARVGKAIAANAGTWTFPVDGLRAGSGEVYGWGYSLKGTPFGKKKNLKRFFGRNLVVSLGTEDIITESGGFPKEEAAMLQGGTRLERGHNFYDCAKKAAEQAGLLFNWELVEVEGVAHSGRGMVYGTPAAAGDEPTPDNISANGAYGILFMK